YRPRINISASFFVCQYFFPVKSAIGRTVKKSLPHDAMKRDMAAILYNNILFIITLKLNIQPKSEISRPWVAIGCVVTQRRHQLWVRPGITVESVDISRCKV